MKQVKCKIDVVVTVLQLSKAVVQKDIERTLLLDEINSILVHEGVDVDEAIHYSKGKASVAKQLTSAGVC